MSWVMIIVGGLLLYMLISAIVAAPGKLLAQKFASAGTLAGKSKDEIVAIVGPPNSVSGLEGGKTLCQWMAAGYHIALRFDGEVCEGVTSESQV